ncbi:MAG: response regulator transcription factor [Chloroflexi bacterium]|nr:response regulator transcription factor [Chloroflexota bacterium]
MLPLRVLVADDHRLFRQGLIGLLHTRPELARVVGEAASGREAVECARTLHPDVILLDIMMPDGDGLAAAHQIHEFLPSTAIVMLTASELSEHLYEAVQLGAAGYLLKSLDASELFDLLESVAHGDAALTRAMAARLLKAVASHTFHADAGEEALTERETDVLRLVAQGASNLQIAEQLCVSVNTIKVHLRNILNKLQLHNRTQAAAFAVRRGIVSPPPTEA